MTDLIKAADALAEEDAAKIIYDAMAWAYEDGSGNRCPAWVERGNSHAQAEARAAASRIFTAYRQARESADGVKVKPLDLSTLLKHAFLSGIVAARNTPAHEEISGPDLWLDYDPTGNAAYTRIKAALET